MGSSILKELEKSLKKIKIKHKKRVKKIEKCHKKSDLKKFTMEELTDWLSKNRIYFRKKDYIDLVWSTIMDTAVSESSDSESSDSGSSESESSDSESSDSESSDSESD